MEGTFRLPNMSVSPFAINLLLFLFLSSQNMTVAKMSVYKQMKLACCFDCGRSERDCSCMSGSVHCNMDTLQRAYPLSSVSVHDCATTLRACKLHRPTRVVTCLLCVPCMCVCVCPPREWSQSHVAMSQWDPRLQRLWTMLYTTCALKVLPVGYYMIPM
ncbi:unnamed protein product [Oncorhynchus mykiss]|uniref:Uncharacterized protein n=1 Tax=Oncorhynchus mykiss TaxID=8022 RepID=A0A060YAB2_ONCMY|nr:unnamed protein product [Oncorhynchus mykiss]